MAYRELPLPDPPAPYVACLWTRDPDPAASVRRILPDACVDVVWVQGDRLVVAGPATGPALPALPAGPGGARVRVPVGPPRRARGRRRRRAGARPARPDRRPVGRLGAAGRRAPRRPPGARRHAGRGGRRAR